MKPATHGARLKEENPQSRVLVLRHTISEKTLKGVNGGDGLPLSDQGIEDARSQARHLVDRFSSYLHSVKIVHAPMIHTRQTAELLAETIPAEVLNEPRFRSAHMGVLDGLSDRECEHKHPDGFAALLEWRQGQVVSNRIAIPGLESSEQFLARVHAGFIAHINTRLLTVFVCSRSVANALVAIMRNFDAGTAQCYSRVRFDPGSITEFTQYASNDFEETRVNDTGYLGGNRAFPND